MNLEEHEILNEIDNIFNDHLEIKLLAMKKVNRELKKNNKYKEIILNKLISFNDGGKFNKPFEQILHELSRSLLSGDEQQLIYSSALLEKIIYWGMTSKYFSKNFEEGIKDYVPLLIKLFHQNKNIKIKNHLLESLLNCTTKEELKKIFGKLEALENFLKLSYQLIKKKKKQKGEDILSIKVLMLIGNLMVNNEKNVNMFLNNNGCLILKYYLDNNNRSHLHVISGIILVLTYFKEGRINVQREDMIPVLLFSPFIHDQVLTDHISESVYNMSKCNDKEIQKFSFLGLLIERVLQVKDEFVLKLFFGFDLLHSQRSWRRNSQNFY
eukprot:TRINITY_DN8170_c0_g1_i1.p1 TRINITY_DN8170_c0_g1~~TRINITY_DN8170_c0_g1_i1.p1  ORF type:complete len:341 (+),score=59.76 TRINITY_DN8170_c0_g1_i1:49-1023(+)